MTKVSPEALASISESIRELPVADQFRILSTYGFNLSMTNWENWKTDPGTETIIPVNLKPVNKNGE